MTTDYSSTNPGNDVRVVSKKALACLCPADQCHLIALLIVAYFRHKRPHQQQTPAASLLDVDRIGWVREFRGVEARTFVANHMNRFALVSQVVT